MDAPPLNGWQQEAPDDPLVGVAVAGDEHARKLLEEHASKPTREVGVLLTLALGSGRGAAQGGTRSWYIYIYIYIHTHIYLHIHTYIYISG